MNEYKVLRWGSKEVTSFVCNMFDDCSTLDSGHLVQCIMEKGFMDVWDMKAVYLVVYN